MRFPIWRVAGVAVRRVCRASLKQNGNWSMWQRWVADTSSWDERDIPLRWLKPRTHHPLS